MKAAAPGATTLVERPPAGPAQGAVSAPVWLVALLTVGLPLLAALLLIRSWRRRRGGALP